MGSSKVVNFFIGSRVDLLKITFAFFFSYFKNCRLTTASDVLLGIIFCKGKQVPYFQQVIQYKSVS